jgi:class 3 adenylate cyclase
MGDGVLIYFGYPEAHEDDAERAARAGLAVIDAVGRLATQELLNVRLGIAGLETPATYLRVVTAAGLQVVAAGGDLGLCRWLLRRSGRRVPGRARCARGRYRV